MTTSVETLLREALVKSRPYVEEAGFRHHDVSELLGEIDDVLQSTPDKGVVASDACPSCGYIHAPPEPCGSQGQGRWSAVDALQSIPEPLLDEGLVSVRIDPATAQTLMDWNVLHTTDAGWVIDLDIWRSALSIPRLEAGRVTEAQIEARIAELRQMKGEEASDIWIIRSEISWLEEKLGGGR